MNLVSGISKSPLYAIDRSPLMERKSYSFIDYGFTVTFEANQIFEIIPTQINKEECFLFFLIREDVDNDLWALFNLHIFLKRTGSLEDFARSLGESMMNVCLLPTTAFNKPAIGYSRIIAMSSLFKGAEQVISFIGGQPCIEVRDSHYYFTHHQSRCYTGVLHPPGQEARYDAFRKKLFNTISFF